MSSEDAGFLARQPPAGMTDMSNEVEIIFTVGRQFYAVLRGPAGPAGAAPLRECGLWLSIEKKPLPVPSDWRRPDMVCACVMRGRDYYRVGIRGPQHSGGSQAISLDDELVKDYRDAAWWTPGLEEAWVELQGMKEATKADIARWEGEGGGSSQKKGKH